MFAPITPEPRTQTLNRSNRLSGLQTSSGWSASTTLKRSDFGVDGPAMLGTALGDDDCEANKTTFASGNLTMPYHSVNTDVNKRIRYL